MEKEEVFEFILKIRETVLKKLDATQTPSYPKYYEKIFREMLTDVNNPEITKLFQRYSQSNFGENADKELEKYIELSKNSIKAFSNSNRSISKTVIAQSNYLDSISLNEVNKAHVNYQKIMESMLLFQGQLLEELRHADEEIRRLETELKQALSESKIDPLTKLLNKRAFTSDMEQLLYASSGKKLDMSILFIDVDDLALINEELGYLAGDKVLIFLANTFKNSVREGDKVYRYGEGKFIIVLNRLALEKSLEIANRIHSKIKISKLIYSEHILKVTVSMGVAHHRDDDNISTILARAVEGLQLAKQNGKNLVKEIV